MFEQYFTIGHDSILLRLSIINNHPVFRRYVTRALQLQLNKYQDPRITYEMHGEAN